MKSHEVHRLNHSHLRICNDWHDEREEEEEKLQLALQAKSAFFKHPLHARFLSVLTLSCTHTLFPSLISVYKLT